jgi:Zinc-binding dehydrogenase
VSRLGVRPIVDPRRFTLDTVKEAHRAVASGGAVGKIVVDLTARGWREIAPDYASRYAR